MATSYNTLGGVYLKSELAAKARVMFEKALPINDKMFWEHPNDLRAIMIIAGTSTNLGLSLLDTERPAEALPHLSRSRQILEDALKLDQRHTITQRFLVITLTGNARLADA